MLTPDSLIPLRSPLFDSTENNSILHGFFTRVGGVSEGVYSSLNVGTNSKDKSEKIAENRRRVAASLNVASDRLLTLYQTHSSHVCMVTEPFHKGQPKADAMVTNKSGLALGILSADCGPVLFADRQARIIGAAHAGWRGAFDNILENTIEAMITLGAQRSNIIAVLGPTIGPNHYEVSSEFYANFIARSAAYSHYFHPSFRHQHQMFNLWNFIIHKLEDMGIETQALCLCTYADEARFFSYRRATHRGESDCGRQISAIVITE